MKTIVTILLFSQLTPHIRCNDAEPPALPQQARYSDIKLGASLAECNARIRWRQVHEVEVTTILQRTPFVWSLAFLKPHQTAIWSNAITNANGWPNFLIAHFAKADKSSLIDLFEVSHGHVTPLLEGRFQKYLESISSGTSIDEVYKHLGQPLCRYAIVDGKPRLSFIFNGFRGRFYNVQVDACKGVVTDCRDVTL